MVFVLINCRYRSASPIENIRWHQIVQLLVVSLIIIVTNELLNPQPEASWANPPLHYNNLGNALRFYR